MFKLGICILFVIAFTNYSFSNENESKDLKEEFDIYEVSPVQIIGNSEKALRSIPGTVNIITREQLQLSKALNGNEIFRSIPGIVMTDEEGAGLRLNLGIRGLDPSRSTKILVMEDGIPIALAPYGEPEMYYTPSIDRMSSVEILKGSGSIIYGPQTIGGVVNYITHDPSLRPGASVNFTGGSGGFLNTKLGYGSTFGSSGILTELYHKKADKIGLTNYTIYDFMSKAKFTLDARSSLSFKIGAYDENSNSTYVGLTQSMYDQGLYYTEIAPNDNMQIKRYSASLNYQNLLSDNIILNTTLYGYHTVRNWRRQDFSRTANPSNFTGVVFGDTTVQNGAIYMRNSTGNRNREFEVVGIQPNIVAETELFGMTHKINSGVRLHFEKTYEKRINGTNYLASSGNLAEDEERSGTAFAAYFHDRINISEKIVVSPGIRFEHFDYDREIFRLSSKDTLISSGSSINAFIPGIGINYNLSDNYTFFIGTHRGFAPPRIKDAITNAGEALELDAELSWNYEFGFRTNPLEFLSLQSTLYYMDFENQTIPVAESAGGLGTGFVNGGRTKHFGLEISTLFDISNIVKLRFPLSLQTNFSYNKANYSADRFITKGEERINIKDNVLPYAPEITFSTILNFRTNFGLGANISATYIGEQYADELNTKEATNDGLTGIIPSYFITDATINYYMKSYNLGIFLSVKNMFDERYIASRRPQGIKVGIPRFITLGIDYSI